MERRLGEHHPVCIVTVSTFTARTRRSRGTGPLKAATLVANLGDKHGYGYIDPNPYTFYGVLLWLFVSWKPFSWEGIYCLEAEGESEKVEPYYERPTRDILARDYQEYQDEKITNNMPSQNITELPPDPSIPLRIGAMPSLGTTVYIVQNASLQSCVIT